MLSGLLSHSVKELSVSEVESLEGAVYLDARAKEEYDVSRIRNAIWVGYENFDPSLVESVPKEKTLIVYCSVGYRSEKIAEKLNQMGYKDVYNLYGGVFEWINKDKEVVNQEGLATDTVHAYSRAWGIWLKKGEKVYGTD